MLVGGVLYLHDLSREDFPESLLKSLAIFSELCDDDAMNQVAFVATEWDRLRDIRDGDDRVVELQEDVWAPTLEQGSQVFRVQPSGNRYRLSSNHKRPWDIIHQLVVGANARDIHERILQIQDEIIKQKRFLPETDAGRELQMSLEDLLRQAKELRRRSKEAARAGRPTPLLQERQEEIERLTAQVEAMKLPGLLTRTKRLFGRFGGS